MKTKSLQNLLTASVLYFLFVFAAGFVLGTVRVLGVAPVLGESRAVLIEVPLMVFISWFVCARLVSRYNVPPVPGIRIIMGSIAFGFLMAAEVILALGLLERTLTDVVAHYGTITGAAGLAGQVVFAIIPFLQSRTSGQ